MRPDDGRGSHRMKSPSVCSQELASTSPRLRRREETKRMRLKVRLDPQTIGGSNGNFRRGEGRSDFPFGT